MYEPPYDAAVARIRPDLGLALSSMPSNAGTPASAVLRGTCDEPSVAIAKMLHEIVPECRGALERVL